jgi:hypothetical protein
MGAADLSRPAPPKRIKCYGEFSPIGPSGLHFRIEPIT